jgi:hypothetical protein
MEISLYSNAETALMVSPRMPSAINILRQADREPNIEMVPLGLMFDHDPYEILIPPTVPELDRPVQPQEAKNILSRKDYLQTQKPSAQKSLERKRK